MEAMEVVRGRLPAALARVALRDIHESALRSAVAVCEVMCHIYFYFFNTEASGKSGPPILIWKCEEIRI